MKRFSDIVGHERAVRVIKRALASGRVAHAYLFWGPDGVGKEAVALATASVLFCGEDGARASGVPCGVCPACKKTEAGVHPDLHSLGGGEKATSVEEVRKLQEALSFQAYEKGRKVVIIREASRMSPAAANALLKTIEEPPPETFLFLLAEHQSRLLPTLVSRCQPVRFDPLSEEDVELVLVRSGVEADAAGKLAALSGGSPGTALALDPAGVTELMEEVARVADTLETMAIARRFELGDRWAKDKELLGLRLKCLEAEWARRVATDEVALMRLARLNTVRSLIERNINAQLALDALFVQKPGMRLEETF